MKPMTERDERILRENWEHDRKLHFVDEFERYKCGYMRGRAAGYDKGLREVLVSPSPLPRETQQTVVL